MKNPNDEIMLHPISNPKDYNILLMVFAFGKLENKSLYFEWWTFNGRCYQIDKWDIDQLEKVWKEN